jgi:hypothetical protein
MLAGTLPAGDPQVNFGELVPTVFRINTRRPDAGGTDANGGIVPANQGFLNVRLLTNQQANQQPVVDPAPNTLSPGLNYYLQTSLGAALTAAQTPDNGDYPSPRAVFGHMLIAPGTERVLGPSSTYTVGGASENVSYFRLPTFSDSSLSQTVLYREPITNPPVYRDFTISSPSYFFDYDLPPTDMLKFAEPPTAPSTLSGVPGLPALVTGSEKELRVTYLWQNNYARKVAPGDPPLDMPVGTPLDANGASNLSAVPGNFDRLAGPPEPDVVKVDYSTRAVFAVNVGARVYDSGTGEAQFIQLADKIQINNVGR